jgi:hypothetical protein
VTLFHTASADPDLLGEVGATVRVLESHHSKWIFDEAGRCFARIPKHADPAAPVEWRPYDRLIVQEDVDAFLIFLDHDGSRVIRARRHEPPFATGEVTEEFSVEELRSLTHR